LILAFRKDVSAGFKDIFTEVKIKTKVGGDLVQVLWVPLLLPCKLM
jgi:hypothetical protein